MADFTEALIPRKPESLEDMLPRLVADDEQLRLLEAIVAGWSRRRVHAVEREVMTEWSRDEGSAQAIEHVVRRQLVDEVDTHWPGALLFSVRLSWHDHLGENEPLDRPRILSPSPHPQALYVRARGTVIPLET